MEDNEIRDTDNPDLDEDNLPDAETKPEPASEPDNELDQLREFQTEVRKPEHEFLAEWEKPLVVDQHGQIQSGVWWVPPFVEPFLCPARPPKPKQKPRCACPLCGAKHARKAA